MKRLIFLAAIFYISFAAQAQQVPAFEGKDTGAQIKASYLYNFSKLVDWPAQYKQGNFVISVMGGSNVHQELVKKYNTKQIGSQQIEIRKVSRTLNISQCHVLFVGEEHIDFLPEISKALENSATLIIADYRGALSKGAALNFVVEDANLKFELDVSNATKRNLFIGSTLKSLALRVQ
jgi:hypothetical protein